MRRRLALVMLTLLFVLFLPSPRPASGLSGWSYRRAITITEQSGSALTDYQVRIDLTSVALTDAAPDGSDIRFTADDGETMLTFWREEWEGPSAGQKKVFWVKVPSIPASGTVTIYVYYANPSASDASDPSATFDDFDHFDTDTSASWNALTGTWTWDTADSQVYCSSTGWNRLVRGDFGAGYAFRARVRGDGVAGSSGDQSEVFLLFGLQSTSDHYTAQYSSYYQAIRFRKRVGGSTTVLASVSQDWDTGWHILETRWLAVDHIKVFFDDEEKLDVTSDLASWTSGQYGPSGYLDSGQHAYFDYVLVRKITDPEPSVSVGDEEYVGGNPPAVTIDSVTPASDYRGATFTLSGTYGDKDGYVTAVYVNITAPSGTRVVTNGLATLSNSEGNGTWTYEWGSSADSETGYYDVDVLAVDNDSWKSPIASQADFFQVLNNPPSIDQSGVVPSPPIPLDSSAMFWVNGTDFEDSASAMAAYFSLQAPNGTWVINNAAMSWNATAGRWEYTVDRLDATGKWLATFTLQDSDGDQDSATLEFNVTAGPTIQSLSAAPSETTRPGTVNLTAYVPDPDTPADQLTVQYKVYDPSGALFASGTMSWNGTDYWFEDSVSVDIGDPVGYYDIHVDATDGSYGDSKDFANAFAVTNVQPSVGSITVEPTAVPRGQEVTFKVPADDPDTQPGGLDVDVTLTSPSGTKVYLQAQWDSSLNLYVATWTPAANAELGSWQASAVATDPDGEQGGPSTASFTVQNSPPSIESVTADPTSVYVNSSTKIWVGAGDYETPTANLNVTVQILKDGQEVAKGQGTYNSTSGKFYYAFNPLSAGSYDVNVTVEDGDGAKTSVLKSGLFTASEAPPQTTAPPETNESLTSVSTTEQGLLDEIFEQIHLDEVAKYVGGALNFLALVVSIVGGIYAIAKAREED